MKPRIKASPALETGRLELRLQRPLGDRFIGVHQQVAAIEDRDGQQVHEADADRQGRHQQHHADEEAQDHRLHIGGVRRAGLGHRADGVTDADHAADLVRRDLAGDQAPQVEADRGDLVAHLDGRVGNGAQDRRAVTGRGAAALDAHAADLHAAVDLVLDDDLAGAPVRWIVDGPRWTVKSIGSLARRAT